MELIRLLKMAFPRQVLSRQFSSTGGLNNVFNHVTIIGGGLMGSGIAQVTAQSGMDVTIVEVNEDAVQRSDSNIKDSMQRVAKKLFQNSSSEAEKYISETMGRLKISTDLKEAVSKTDLVVEAIVENLPAKHRLFSRIDTMAPEHTIFASNTSSIPISEIASVTLRKDKFGGLHFFNPVPVMKLLEVVRTEDTSEDTYQKLLNWGKAIGKTCITCKDTPGFVVNRLLVPYLAEAVRMLERNIASPRDIDTAMKLGAGYPMGPLELLDYVGLDTTKFILDGWHQKYPDNPLFHPIPLLEKLVSESKLGKKTGEGFYIYKKNTSNFTPPLHSPYFQPLPESIPSAEMIREQIQRLVSRRLKAEAQESEQKKEKELPPESRGKSWRYASLDRWKNTDEFLCERDKQNTNSHRKPTRKRLLKQPDILAIGEALKSSGKLPRIEKWKNWATAWKCVPNNITCNKWMTGKF